MVATLVNGPSGESDGVGAVRQVQLAQAANTLQSQQAAARYQQQLNAAQSATIAARSANKLNTFAPPTFAPPAGIGNGASSSGGANEIFTPSTSASAIESAPSAAPTAPSAPSAASSASTLPVLPSFVNPIPGITGPAANPSPPTIDVNQPYSRSQKSNVITVNGVTYFQQGNGLYVSSAGQILPESLPAPETWTNLGSQTSTAPSLPNSSPIPSLPNSSPIPSSILPTPLPSAPTRPLDITGVGTETPNELALAATINANEANAALGRNPQYANMLNSALQTVAAKNTLARQAANFQNALYLDSIYNSLVQSRLSPAQLLAMLGNAYAAVNANVENPTAPVANAPFVPIATANQLKNQQQLATMIANIANMQNIPTPVLSPAQQFAQTSEAARIPTIIPEFPQQTQTIQFPAALAANPIQLPTAPTLPQVSLQSVTPSAGVNPNAFLEALNPYSSPPPALSTPVLAQLGLAPALSRNDRNLQLVRLPA